MCTGVSPSCTFICTHFPKTYWTQPFIFLGKCKALWDKHGQGCQLKCILSRLSQRTTELGCGKVSAERTANKARNVTVFLREHTSCNRWNTVSQLHVKRCYWSWVVGASSLDHVLLKSCVRALFSIFIFFFSWVTINKSIVTPAHAQSQL